MSKQQFKAQADICKKALDTLHKAIELDPVNVEEYEAGIAYTEGVMKASNAIVKACEIVEPTKKQKEEPKAEEAETKSLDNHIRLLTVEPCGSVWLMIH